MTKLLPFVILWIASQLVKYIPDEIGPDNPSMKKLYIYEVFWDGAESDEGGTCQLVLATNIRIAVELAEADKPKAVSEEITRIDRRGYVDAMEKLPEGEGPYR